MIEFLDAQTPESSTVDFIGGPRDTERTILDHRPSEIKLPTGSYVRSVQCADDGAHRYVWNPGSVEVTDG